MVEMQIDSLTIDHQKRLPIILLREYFGRGRTLAIPVGSIEGMALSLVLNSMPSSPMLKSQALMTVFSKPISFFPRNKKVSVLKLGPQTP